MTLDTPINNNSTTEHITYPILSDRSNQKG